MVPENMLDMTDHLDLARQGTLPKKLQIYRTETVRGDVVAWFRHMRVQRAELNLVFVLNS